MLEKESLRIFPIFLKHKEHKKALQKVSYRQYLKYLYVFIIAKWQNRQIEEINNME
jgi:hypothetical protein